MRRLMIGSCRFSRREVQAIGSALNGYVQQFEGSESALAHAPFAAADVERLLGAALGADAIIDLDAVNGRMLLEVGEREALQAERVLLMFAAVGLEGTFMAFDGDQAAVRYVLRRGRLHVQGVRVVVAGRDTRLVTFSA